LTFREKEERNHGYGVEQYKKALNDGKRKERGNKETSVDQGHPPISDRLERLPPSLLLPLLLLLQEECKNNNNLAMPLLLPVAPGFSVLVSRCF